MDLCFSKDVLSDLRETIQRFQPELIGFSLRNLDNLTYPTSVSYLGEAEEIIRVCRRSSSARLVIGGSGYSLAPGKLLHHFDVDFGIIGEGEEILIQLIRSLERETHLSIPPSPRERKARSSIDWRGKSISARNPLPEPLLLPPVSGEVGWSTSRQSEAVPFPASTAPTLIGRKGDQAERGP